MEQYFKEFESKLQLSEEKLDILSEWHIAKGHNGASEIAEQCRQAITTLWIEFYKLSERYKQAEASHEGVLKSNLDHLLGELKRYDDECAEGYKEAPDWLLFNYLNKAINTYEEPEKIITDPTSNIWYYLRRLVMKDLKEKGVIND